MDEDKNQPKKIDQFKDAYSTSLKLTKLVWEMDSWLFLGTLASVLLPAITPFLTAYTYKLIIDVVVTSISVHTLDYPHLFFLLGVSVAINYFNRMAFSLQSYATRLIFNKMPIKLYEMVLTKISTLDLKYFEDSEFKDLMQRVRESYTNQPQQLIYNLFFLLQSILQVLIALVAILKLNAFLGLLIFLISIPDIINQIYFSKATWSIWGRNTPQRKRSAYLTHILQDHKDIKEIKIFLTAKRFIKELTGLQIEFFNETKKVSKKQLLADSGFNLLDIGVNFGILAYVILEAVSGRITVGDISFYQSVVSNFNNGISGAFRNIGNIFEQSLYVKSLFEVMDIESNIKELENPVKIDFNKSHRIEFKDVSFRYPGTKRDVFKYFSLIIEPGERAAFVGENGAGKTTLIKLLARFYDVDAGEILIDGVNIKDLELESWYKSLGVLFQDFVHYDDTVRDNIYYGRVWEKESLDKITDAARQSGADEMIKKLEHEYDQMIGRQFEGGVELSGGQWQKIALARAFFRNAPVLVLDEPTSAIDAKGESEIFNKVEKLSKDKTVIIISHRFSTVRNADKIYVIENGKIVESGDHQALMKKNGQYALLFNLQAKGYR